MKQPHPNTVTIVLVVAALFAVGSTSRTTGHGGVQAMDATLTGWEFVTSPPMPIADVAAVQPDGVVRVSGTPVGRAVGEWNTCDVTCRKDVIDVVVNGVMQNRVTGVSVASGKVGFQLEGTPFELRNVSITPVR